MNQILEKKAVTVELTPKQLQIAIDNNIIPYVGFVYNYYDGMIIKIKVNRQVQAQDFRCQPKKPEEE